MREDFINELSPTEISKDPNDVDQRVVDAIMEDSQSDTANDKAPVDAQDQADAKCGKIGSTVGKIVAGATIPLYVAAVSHIPSAVIRQHEVANAPQT